MTVEKENFTEAQPEEIRDLRGITYRSAILFTEGEDPVTGSDHAQIVDEMGQSRELLGDPNRIGWMVFKGIGEPVFISVTDFERSGSFAKAIQEKMNDVDQPVFNGVIKGEARAKIIKNHIVKDAILLDSGEVIVGDNHSQIVKQNNLEPEEISPQQIGWYIDNQFVSEVDLENSLTTDRLLERLDHLPVN